MSTFGGSSVVASRTLGIVWPMLTFTVWVELLTPLSRLVAIIATQPQVNCKAQLDGSPIIINLKDTALKLLRISGIWELSICLSGRQTEESAVSSF